MRGETEEPTQVNSNPTETESWQANARPVSPWISGWLNNPKVETAKEPVTRQKGFPSAAKVWLPENLPFKTEMAGTFMPDLLTPSPLSVTTTGGQFVSDRYTNQVGTRAYRLYIPTGYSKKQYLPLVVMLHGCTQNATDFATGTRMNELAEKSNFMVLYPEQSSSANPTRCWNWFQEAHHSREKGEPSLIAGMTHQIIEQYKLNDKLVFIAGMSAGGAMAAIMGATYPDLYTAVGVHSGLFYGAARNLPSAIAAMKVGANRHPRQLATFRPLIVFHGERDTTVAPANAEHLIEQWLQATTGNCANNTEAVTLVEPGQVARGHDYTRYIYRDSNGRTLMEKWLIHQAGHAWSGGNANGSYTDPKGPDASTEMLRFFLEQGGHLT
jgi:poly(hydroxyalkanoate) depolymerase family esterase